MALAVTKKQKRERDNILKSIEEYARKKDKEGAENPCDLPSSQKYPATKKACKNLVNSLTAKTDIASKQAEAEQNKQTAELMKQATAPTDSTGGAGAGAAQPAGAASAQPTGDMTMYYAIGGGVLLLIGVGAFFLLRKPSAESAAPAK